LLLKKQSRILETTDGYAYPSTIIGDTMKYKETLVLAVALSCSGLFAESHAQLLTKKTVSLALAKKVAAAAEAEAAQNKLAVVITILDDGGNMVYVERMDGAQLGSIEVAKEKALTAIYFKRPSKAYEDRVTAGETKLLKIPNALPIEGGIPLLVDGVPVGAIGVSGGTPQQDGAAAKAGVDAFTLQ
jgi:uncharacterized protein GlcG (DUF336 family)